LAENTTSKQCQCLIKPLKCWNNCHIQEIAKEASESSLESPCLDI
jgi:hypothetical protein